MLLQKPHLFHTGDSCHYESIYIKLIGIQLQL